jgi:sucrose-6-phosphate hydrolase SacC (GH32 family)
MSDTQAEAEKTAKEIEHVARLIESARELRERLQQDPHRPMYHLMGPEDYNCPFDPHGCIYWKGRYHIFYPYFPGGVNCWGHVSSADLVHWTCHPPAITMSPGDAEQHAYAGGSLVSRDGVPTLIYRGGGAGTCIATSHDDGLIHWTKHPNNPVIPIPKEGDPEYGTFFLYDTCGWVDGEFHYSLSGNIIDSPPKPQVVGDMAWLFRSRDMVHWEYRHPFYQSDRRWTGPEEDCSCPDFFPLGDKHVLMFISHFRGTQYYIGRYENEKFYPEQHGRMNWPGGACFAQETLVDGKGRRIFWAWAVDHRTRTSALLSGWAGVLTLPRVLSLAANGSMRIEPAEELEVLRYDHRRHANITLAATSEWVPPDVSGDCLEISMEVDLTPGSAFGVKVRCSPDGEEQTSIVYDPAARTLSVDTRRSTLNTDVVQPWPLPLMAFFTDTPLEDGRKDVRVQEAPLELPAGGALNLRIFLDRSMLEVFANSCQCLTQRIYPSRADSMGVVLFSRGGESTVRQFNAWKMNPSNPW